MKFFKYGDAYKYYHTPTLPLPLLKLESEALAVKLKPDCDEDKIGGYQEINIRDWKRPENLEHQPKWCLNWFWKHPHTINSYDLAPRGLRTNAVLCPCIRRRSWTQFAKIYSTRPTYLNFPILRGPPSNRRPTEFYMTNELTDTIELYNLLFRI